MENPLLNRRCGLAGLLGVCPYLLGSALMVANVWVDALTLFPLLLLVVCVNFNAAKSARAFVLLQAVQFLWILGYSWLCGRSYSLYLTGEGVSSDIAVFSGAVATVLLALTTIILAAVKSKATGAGVRTGVTVTLLCLAGIMMLPAVLVAFLWLLMQML